jgi:pyrroloquinoline quinone (PQQ) biosynthesis protein C
MVQSAASAAVRPRVTVGFGICRNNAQTTAEITHRKGRWIPRDPTGSRFDADSHFCVFGVSRYAGRDGLVTGGNENGTQRRSRIERPGHRADIGNPRALAHQATSVFLAFGEGKLPLKALGRYQALHYHFVSRALASFGLLYARGYHFEDVRKMIAENIAEEEGLKAIPEPGHEPHDHNELILRFCRAAGISDDEVRSTKMPPAWWARSLYMYHTTATEPVGVILAMQTTQEGQMPGLIGEVLLPAFEKHYGFKRTAPEIEFFTEHDAADVEHSRRQIKLCGRHLDTPQLEGRAEQVAQEICELRWASISELYRSEVLGEKEILPPDVG